MLTICILVLAGLYAVQLIVLLFGLRESEQAGPDTGGDPTVSVIVAARNEEESIGSCISSLIALDYPGDKFEIIAVNDGSTDRTADIMTSFSGRHPNFKVVHTTPGTGRLRGKTNALVQGISSSKGEILMFTDADCRVPAAWIKDTVKRFDERTGIVGGFTLLDSNNIFEGIQALDWLFLFSLASSGAGLGIPLTVIGNNFSIRRKAYDATGGFEKIPFSVTEDYALVHAVVRDTDWRVKFPIDPNTLIRSSACSSWREIYRQKERWGVGGLDMIFTGFLIMAVGYLAKIALLVSLVTIPLKIAILLFVMMFLAECGYLMKPIGRFKVYRLMKYFPAFFFYLFSYVLLLPFVVAFSRHIVWKARTIPSK